MNFENDRLLSSWKEIASSLGRGVRTVQRWESLGLPVLRPAGRDSNVVMAVESEIQAWMHHYLITQTRQSSNAEIVEQLSKRLRVMQQRIDSLAAHLESLQNQLDAFSESLHPAKENAVKLNSSTRRPRPTNGRKPQAA
jgi:TolA-binding protein